MEIEWPPFPADGRMLQHTATEDDLAEGRAAFVMGGTHVPMGLSRLGFVGQGDERRMGVAVQVEAIGKQMVIGVRHTDENFSICTPKEFDTAPRALILFNKPNYTLADAERIWANSRSGDWKIARQKDVLALRWKDSPILFIRHATGDAVAQEIRLVDNPRAGELKDCTSLFEVSFLDLDEMLEDTNTLVDVQATLQDATEGWLYLEWNGILNGPGE